MAGNTSDKTTLKEFIQKIEKQYGQAERIWVMDRGIPTEETLKEMRESVPPVGYLVGTPRARWQQFEKQLLDLPWEKMRESEGHVCGLIEGSHIEHAARTSGLRRN